jgi:uncharacterized protein (TIGR00369 family)
LRSRQARIGESCGPGDDKVVFWNPLIWVRHVADLDTRASTPDDVPEWARARSEKDETEMSETENSDPALGGEDVLSTLGNGRVRLSDGEAGRAVLEFTCAPAMCHSGGVAQGGFVTGWIDSAMAHACIARYTTDFWIATLEVKVSFFKPANPGLVIADGWIERAGKQTVFTEGQLLDGDGNVLAKASSTIRLVPNRV